MRCAVTPVGMQARQQWERVLRHSGKCLASWVEAAKWERQVSGDLDACRRLYERGMKEVQDYPEVRRSVWVWNGYCALYVHEFLAPVVKGHTFSFGRKSGKRRIGIAALVVDGF